MKLKLKKVSSNLPFKVKAHTDCEVKIWARKTEAEGWQSVYWWKIGYTARGTTLW